MEYRHQLLNCMGAISESTARNPFCETTAIFELNLESRASGLLAPSVSLEQN